MANIELTFDAEKWDPVLTRICDSIYEQNLNLSVRHWLREYYAAEITSNSDLPWRICIRFSDPELATMFTLRYV